MGRVEDLLGCALPIQLAPMGGVSVGARLPLAVAAAGGHAVYPSLATPPRALAAVLEQLEGHAAGVNFLVPLMDRDSLDVALDHAPYVDFFLAEPTRKLVDLVHAGGAVCGWQVESAEEARAAEAAGCDIVIAKGSESGGRKRIEAAPLAALLEAVVEAVNVPVIAAGGIATAQDVTAALAAGAEGVRVGTRFIASEEAEAHPLWQAAVVEADTEEAVVTYAFNAGMPVPGPHRVLRRSIEAAEALPEDAPGRFAPFPPSATDTGAVAAMPFYAGTSAGAVHSVQPAAAIVADLARGLP